MKGITVGIDIGTSMVRVFVTSKIDKNAQPAIVAIGTTMSRGVKHGYIVDREMAVRSIQAAVRDAEQKSGIKIKRAYIAINGVGLKSEVAIGSTTPSKADREITNIDIQNAVINSEQAIDTENRRPIHRIPFAYRLDGKEVMGKPTGMKGVKLEVKVLFISCMNMHLEECVESVTQAGVEVIDVIAGPLAEAGLVLGEQQRSVGSAVVNIGTETTSIAVFENGLPVSVAVFPIGSADITKDIALGLKVPFEDADQIKKGRIPQEVSKRKLDDIISARLTDIFELVDSHLKKIKRSGLLPSGIYLTGGGIKFPFIENVAKDTLRLPIRTPDPDIWGNTANRLPDASYFVVASLCNTEFKSIAEPETFEEGVAGIPARLKKFFKGILVQLMP
ncbi:MAG: cell division protein FtsA [Minisyncoccia bacterium]